MADSLLIARRGGILSGMELVVEVRDAVEGGYWARALGWSIFTQGDSWEELQANVTEAVAVYFDDCVEKPASVRLVYGLEK